MKLILTIDEPLNEKITRLARKRCSSKAGLTRWALTKLIEDEATRQGVKNEMD